jgi:putative Mg2+ transporter-C (MgtC) family protein
MKYNISARFARAEPLPMPLVLDWKDLWTRIGLTVFAGLVIGFNRGEHGRPAGMRTTLLVCLAASLSMIQTNLLLGMAGRKPDSFIMLDLMRLPLGVLSGMGFIGAGAILRRQNMVVGVTTAATLWFTTVLGLCFGGGQLELGLIALAIGWATLWGLKYVEGIFKQDQRATFGLSISKGGPSDDELRVLIAAGRCKIISWGARYTSRTGLKEIRAEVEWHARVGDTRMPPFISKLAENSYIETISWTPQGISPDRDSPDSGPFGTPIPTSPAE